MNDDQARILLDELNSCIARHMVMSELQADDLADSRQHVTETPLLLMLHVGVTCINGPPQRPR